MTFSCVFFRSCLTLFIMIGRKKENKRQSSNILFGLILLLHFFRTVNVAINWWSLWRAFIRNGDTSDNIAISFFGLYPSPEYWVSTVSPLINTFSMVIVDCIMVCSVNEFQLMNKIKTLDLEMLDNLQPCLDICNHANGSHFRMHWYGSVHLQLKHITYIGY